jgi:hypothetical protein
MAQLIVNILGVSLTPRIRHGPPSFKFLSHSPRPSCCNHFLLHPVYPTNGLLNVDVSFQTSDYTTH